MSELEGAGKKLPFLPSGFHKNTRKGMVLGLLLVVATPGFSLQGRILTSRGRAMAESGGSKVRLLGFESRPWHLPSEGPRAYFALCTSASFPNEKSNKKTIQVVARMGWDSTYKTPSTVLGLRKAHDHFSWHHLSRGALGLGLTYTQDAV